MHLLFPKLFLMCLLSGHGTGDLMKKASSLLEGSSILGKQRQLTAEENFLTTRVIQQWDVLLCKVGSFPSLENPKKWLNEKEPEKNSAAGESGAWLPSKVRPRSAFTIVIIWWFGGQKRLCGFTVSGQSRVREGKAVKM